MEATTTLFLVGACLQLLFAAPLVLYWKVGYVWMIVMQLTHVFILFTIRQYYPAKWKKELETAKYIIGDH